MTLTPAYDLTPQLRSGDTATQAMAITPDGRKDSRLGLCIEAADVFHLTRSEAIGIIERQLTVIAERWPAAAEAAGLAEREAQAMWGRQILNPAIHYRDF